jgi:hypothetical protein
MKNGMILVVAAGVLVLLALVVYNARQTTLSDEVETADAARVVRATAVSGSGRMRPGAGGGGGPEARPGTSSGSQRGNDRAAGGFGAPARPRVPDAIPGGSMGGGIDSADERGGIEDPELAAAPAVAGRDVPAASHGSAALPGSEAESDTMPPLRPNVVYEGGERVFDTTSRQQITDRRPISGDAGSISFWAQPQWEAGNEDRASFVQIGENGLRIVKDGDYLRFEYTNAHGDNEVGGVADISNWQPGEWRYIAASWQGGNLFLYVDGQRMKVTTPVEPPPPLNDPRLYVGSSTSGMPSAPAQMTNLTVSKMPITLSQIAQNFGKGPPKP